MQAFWHYIISIFLILGQIFAAISIRVSVRSTISFSLLFDHAILQAEVTLATCTTSTDITLFLAFLNDLISLFCGIFLFARHYCLLLLLETQVLLIVVIGSVLVIEWVLNSLLLKDRGHIVRQWADGVRLRCLL